ncbi:MAG TPA: CPBP family intramembrane glutamic endopeptidase [Polyangia bacterium]|nr:CPBP family intramembrane glutamic endopeptidase [Polyangia bacterium]
MSDERATAATGQRILRSAPVRLVLGLAMVIAGTVAAQLADKALHLPALVANGIAIAACVGSYVAFVRLIERRAVVELGRAGAAADMARGAAVGAALFCATMAILTLVAVAHIARGDGWRALLLQLVAALTAAFAEEILVRGVFFRIVAESLGSLIAVALSAGIFGVLHAFNPGATLVSTLSIAFEAGVLLAAAYVYSGRLWLPIGLHFAWNFTEGGVFGASVSGHPAHGLFLSTFDGPTLLSGGAFGPEASIVAVTLCCATGVALLLAAGRRGRIVAPFWRRAARQDQR